MIELKELRIGNLVLNEGKEHQIQSISKKKVTELSRSWLGNETFCFKGFDIEPIKITLGWCYKFKEFNVKNVKISIGVTSKDVFVIIGKFRKKIEFVHQYQNLYFALKEEELELK